MVELKASPKLIVKREGMPGNISWASDKRSFTIGYDRHFELSEFCEVHHKASIFVQERVHEIMLGLEADTNESNIQGNLTYRQARWSFVLNTENKLVDVWKILADMLRSFSFRGKPFVEGTVW